MLKTFFNIAMKYKYTILTESAASIVSVGPTHPGSSGEKDKRDSLSADMGSPEVKASEAGTLAVSEEGVTLSADVGSPEVEASEPGSLAVIKVRESLSADVEDYIDSSDVEVSVDFDLGFNIF